MKRKFIYFLSAIIMAFTLSVCGVGNTYIKAEASSGLLDPLWNTGKSFEENIGRHMLLWANVAGVAVAPNLVTGGSLLINASDFYDFMVNDGYSSDVANAVCHGGGGFVRDGIRRDSDGNTTYSDEVSDLFYKYLLNYMSTESGYYVVETTTPYDLMNFFGGEVVAYQNFLETMNNFDYAFVVISCKSDGNKNDYTMYELPSLTFYDSDFTSSDPFKTMECILIDKYLQDGYWKKGALTLTINGVFMSHLSLIRAGVLSRDGSTVSPTDKGFSFPLAEIKLSSTNSFRGVVTSDGRLCKVFTSPTGYMDFNFKEQKFYVSDSFNTYNTAQDNSVTVSKSDYQIYSDESSNSTIYNNIQYNIDNSGSDLTEDDIRRIVDDTLKDFLDNLPNEEDNKDDDTGNDFIVPDGSVSGNGTGGNGLNNFVGGLGSLLDFLLNLIGSVIGMISEFLNSALKLLGNLTSFTDGFSTFLSSAFKFLPEEAIGLICSGIGLVITLGIIKYMRN